MNHLSFRIVSSLLAGLIAWTAGAATSSPALDDAQIMVEIRVFDHWPNHPKLEFNIGQRSAEAPAPTEQPATSHRMNKEEVTAFMAAARKTQDDRNPILTTARLLVNSGQTASIRIGTNDDNGEPIDGMRAIVKPSMTTDGKIELAFSYEAFGLEVRAPASEFDSGDRISTRSDCLTLSAGDTEFMVATGYIGAPMHLLSVTVHVIDDNAHE